MTVNTTESLLFSLVGELGAEKVQPIVCCMDFLLRAYLHLLGKEKVPVGNTGVGAKRYRLLLLSDGMLFNKPCDSHSFFSRLASLHGRVVFQRWRVLLHTCPETPVTLHPAVDSPGDTLPFFRERRSALDISR